MVGQVPMKLLHVLMLLLLLLSWALAEPVASTPPKYTEPTRMTVNYTTREGAIISYEIYWDKKSGKWKGNIGGQDFDISQVPDARDTRFKIYATDWECTCD